MLEIATLSFWLYVGGALVITTATLFLGRALTQEKRIWDCWRITEIYQQFGVEDIEN